MPSVPLSWFIFRATVSTFNLGVNLFTLRGVIFFFSDYPSWAKNVEIIQASKWAEEFAIHVDDAIELKKKYIIFVCIDFYLVELIYK